MSTQGIKPRVWRSVEESSHTPQTGAPIESEFPSESLTLVDEMKRRSFLKLLGATMAAAGVTSCTRQPIEQIVPYVREPQELVPGEPLYFATAMPLGGYGTGILVKSREGRPIKADGNPDHPASGRGSSVWIQACLLDLYNPERAKAVEQFGAPSSYAQFESWLHERLREQNERKGAGLRILTGCVTSPTLALQIRTIRERFPEARWHQWEPINWDNALEGARLAFGEQVATRYEISKAAVIASFESDFLYTHPERLRYTREFTDGRRVLARKTAMNRLYAVESSPTVTGSMADNRLPLAPSKVEKALRYVARQLGIRLNAQEEVVHPSVKRFLDALVADLQNARGKSLVIVGEYMAPECHALGEAINQQLGNVGTTITHLAPAQAEPVVQVNSLRELAEAMDRGAVDLLLIMAGNPVYDAPADLEFGHRLQRVKHAVHLTLFPNETSRRCEWQIPQTHFLEAWSDIRSFDGTATIMQPLIAPLFAGKSEHEFLEMLAQSQSSRSGYELVRAFWREKGLRDDFETSWRVAVHDGIVKGSASPPKRVQMRGDFVVQPTPAESNEVLEITFRPDPHLWDGRFAQNPWLQETPKPLSKLVWDNAALVSPTLAKQRQLETGDIVAISNGNQTIEIPAFIMAGQAENAITLPLGYGQETHNGGFNVYPARRAESLWQAHAGGLRKIGRRYDLVTTQTHHRTHDEDRQVCRETTLNDFLRNPNLVKEESESPGLQETLYNPHDYDYPLKWGMAIDLTSCTGCNACVVACNIENNIPIVGKKQVAINREMLWLRIDTYFSGELDRPNFTHQPVPCMHCENAPCEYVCPVAATLHDHEGLNLQVYNRCIGTRYCSNNCPYKVRRFNFLRYSNYESELGALGHNPEVTVRWRGVMEKCTYCIQRISAARIRSKEENRPIHDGEVKTACQEACPAGAIVFGIMTDENAEVAKAKRHSLDFSMLGQLNTRPRTTYAAKLRNPGPEAES